jgi:hypothetical protein
MSNKVPWGALVTIGAIAGLGYLAYKALKDFKFPSLFGDIPGLTDAIRNWEVGTGQRGIGININTGQTYHIPHAEELDLTYNVFKDIQDPTTEYGAAAAKAANPPYKITNPPRESSTFQKAVEQQAAANLADVKAGRRPGDIPDVIQLERSPVFNDPTKSLHKEPVLISTQQGTSIIRISGR